MTRRLSGILAMISATWLALALVTTTPLSSAAIDTADASIPVNPSTTLEMHASANCVTAQANCFFDTNFNLRAPEGPIGFPGELWARQTTTLRTMDRSVYVEADFNAPDTRLFKSLTDVEFTTIFFGGGPPERFQFHGNAWPTDWRTGGPRTDTSLIVCAHVQVVYAGVNLTSPDACAQAAFS